MKKVLCILSLAFMASCDVIDPKCDTTVTFINKTPESLQISVNGLIPSGCGFVGPDSKCSTIVSPDVTLTYEAKGSKNNKWAGSEAIPKCKTDNISLTY
jgi:hypothetical protein